MSDEPFTGEQPQNRPKHAGGRPRKPVPTPLPPPPAPYSHEETLRQGDQAALSATPSARLRWCSDRIQIVRDIQARDDAEHENILRTENKRLMERVEKLEKEREKPERELAQKNRELIQARGQNEEFRKEVNEIRDEHDRMVNEFTKDRDAAVARAAGLLTVARCAAHEMKDFSETERIEYAARLMSFSLKQSEVTEQLEKLLENPNAHEDYYAEKFRNRPRDRVDLKVNPFQFEESLRQEKAAILELMEEDVEKLPIARSYVIPIEVMNQVSELLSVTDEKVRPVALAKLQEQKLQEQKLRAQT